MKKNSITIFIVSLVVILGGLLRLTNLEKSPPSINWDEAALGYNAYSVSQTLKDEYGKTLPVFTRSFDEYKSTLPMYLMIPSIRLFGLNEIGVRAPSALIGTLTITVVYLLSLKITSRKDIAIASSLLFAIAPWSVHLSRVYQEATVALFLYLLFLYMFLVSLNKPKYFVIAAIFAVISMFTYNANKILVPLSLIWIVFNFKENIKILHKKSRKEFYLGLSVLVVGAISLAYYILIGEGLARAESTNIFRLVNTGNFLNQIFGRYIANFSPANLFLREANEPATVVPNISMFYMWQFPFILTGSLLLIRNYSKYKKYALLLLLMPVPAILTWNWFQPGRVMTLLTAYCILGGVGIAFLLDLLRKLKLSLFWLGSIALIVISLVSSIYLWDAILIQLPAQVTGNWQPGFRESMPIVMKYIDNYDKVIVDTPHAQPYIFFLFYGNYSPSKYLDEVDYESIGTPRKAYDFGKVEFKSLKPEDLDKITEKTLFVVWNNSDVYNSFSESSYRLLADVKNIADYPIVKVVGSKE